MPQQEIAIDRLVNVIQAIQLGRGTGTLTARRGEGVATEEGKINFVKGQCAEAYVGRHKGSDAFNVLSTWSNCFFSFVSSDPNEHPIFFAIKQPGPPRAETGATPAPPFVPISPLRRSFTGEESSPVNPVTPPPLPFTTMVPQLVQQTSVALRRLEQMNLSRAHRQILLLVNGQRSIAELARMSGRSQDEASRLAHDLERAAIIRLS